MADARGLTLMQRLSRDPRLERATPAEALTDALESILQSRRAALPARWQQEGERRASECVAGSVLNFGIPPVENWRLANDAHQAALAREVERAIDLFEPRIRVLGVSVRMTDGSGARAGDQGGWSDQIVLKIHAEWRESGARVEVEAGWGVEEHRVWFRRRD